MRWNFVQWDQICFKQARLQTCSDCTSRTVFDATFCEKFSPRYLFTKCSAFSMVLQCRSLMHVLISRSTSAQLVVCNRGQRLCSLENRVAR